MILRTRFAKKAAVRYISHLELMGTLRRAFRRAELPVVYSQGFNPHQQLALGQPLPVGMTGEGEYFDLELEREIPGTDFIERVNRKLPGGVELLEAREVPGGVKSLMAVIDTAIYLLNLELNQGIEEEKIIDDLLAGDEFMVLRHRRKKQDREINLRPLIEGIEIAAPGLWRFTVKTGSSGNVRPEEISRALHEHYSGVAETPLIKIVREGLYVRKGGDLYRPYDQVVTGKIGKG